MKQMKRMIIFFLLVLSISLSGQISNATKMVLIPKGEFNMGKNSAGPSDWQPEHKVTIDAFYLDPYEVTNRQYTEFCVATKHTLPMFWGMKEFQCGLEFPDHPVVGVSWFEAEQYARWAGKRLPTEAEWEYSARGGLTDRNFPNGDKNDSTLANFGGKFKGSLKIGSFQPNGYGLYDMAGNVWEWTADNYQDDYYMISPSANPKGPEIGRFKVIRGGSWHSGAMCNQTYFRNGLSPSWLDFAVGFRCAKDVSQ
jgi:iron(II)-dependent oxidoreductase